ncbi:glycosyl transferase/glycoside hydrolase-like protein [Niallia nealsonii AAU1]|nr:glycosyl transferase/glycoside hydrolase-like protein [Niallia nealsonii AAU1]
MNGSYFQLIVINKIPFMNYFSKDKHAKKEFYEQTINFINFLYHTEKDNPSYTIQLVIPPIYLEMLDLPSFREEITEFLEKEARDVELLSYWLQKEKNLLKVLKKLIQENRIELLGSPASFSLLSNVSTSTGVQLQMEMGLSIIDDYLDYRPKGFWFPEGYFSPGLDLYLKKEKLTYSYLNSATIYHSDPLPSDVGIAVESPHDVVFFPIEESLYQIFQVENVTKHAWDKAIMELLESYNHYTNESVLSLPINLDNYVKVREDLNKTIRYLSDEGYMVHITPNTYLTQFSQGMDHVHLCASFLNRDRKRNMHKQSSSYVSLAFMEREIHQWRQTTLNTDSQRIQKQLEKEWIMLSALLYQDNGEKEVAADYLDAANKLSRYLKGSIDKEWLSFREQEYPILNTTIQMTNQKLIQKESANRKKALILSWEYPPNVIGGLGTHVVGLTSSLVKNGYEVHLITAQDMNKGAEDVEEKDGLFVYRVKPMHSMEHNFIHWIGGLNLAMWDKAVEIAKHMTFDLIQAHDWLVGAAALSLKDQFQIPLIATIHATEHGRNGGIYTEMQKFIHEKERQLIHAADSLIVCSEYMQNEVMTVFEVEQAKISVIPNGVESLKMEEISLAPIESSYLNSNQKIIFAMGRMVKEKGFGTLLEAARKLLKKRSDISFVIAGVGPMYDEYQKFIERNRLSENVRLIGYLQEEQKNAFYAHANIVVIPSSYEPFGIVALESLVFAIPTIVSQTGGLKGIIKDKETGLYMEPNNAENLVENIEYLLENPLVGKEIGQNGKKLVSHLFSWNRIGEETRRVFDELIVHAKVKESISN